ncbi:MAG TPA: hypothetical protein VEF76_14745, partial [Patescibacteria group bacterium]|nr:hypothetical protein [Patescibacteria group bacterium]
MESGHRKYLLGILGCALVISCAGTAIALDIPLPARKPAQAAEGSSFAFITKIRPERSPVPAAAPDLSAMRPEAVALAAIVPAAGDAQADASGARLSPAVFAKQPSLLDRMFSHLGVDRLSDGDAERYQKIFVLQEDANFGSANAEIEQLSDHRLMGHVLYQRYTRAEYNPTYKELTDWMKRYADHPGAQKIYDLAVKKKPKKDAERLVNPRVGKGVYSLHDFDVGQLAQPYIRGRSHSPAQRDLIRAVGSNLGEAPSAALTKLEKNRSAIDTTEYDGLQGDIAASYFYNGKIEKAYELASAAAKRSGA